MRPRRVPSLLLLGLVALASCRSAGTSTPGEVAPSAPEQEPGTAAQEPGATAAMPPDLALPCREFLAQLQCWLRASGNDAADVERAVANARARFEARAGAPEACERAMVYRRPQIESAGCAHAGMRPGALPTSAVAECPPGEYYFVRRDGHVSGCHRDCTGPGDCPDGSGCVALGSAAGGPIDERFCE